MSRISKKANITMWALQGLLGLLFLFAGGSKLILPVEAMQDPIALPGAFLRFIGVAEVAGALGLILPGIFRIRPSLTPLAAVGLVAVMTGATTLSVVYIGLAPAIVPLIVGVLALVIVFGRGGAAIDVRVPTIRLSGVRQTATITLGLAITALVGAPARGGAQEPMRKGYAPANGVNYYYEIYGRGKPVLILHGGLGSIGMFAPGLPELAKSRQVIAVDAYGHGRTALTERPIDYKTMGDDMAAVLKQLGFGAVDVFGYSMGGGIALRLAVQHPESVRRLVMMSTVFSTDGFYAEMLPQQAAVGAAMADAMKPTPIYTSYMAVAPRPQDFPKLLDSMGAWMRTTYDWSEDVKKLKGPVMLIYADADMIRPEHIVRFYQLLGGGLRDAGWQREHMSPNRLAILPNQTHYDIALSPLVVPTVLGFLK